MELPLDDVFARSAAQVPYSVIRYRVLMDYLNISKRAAHVNRPIDWTNGEIFIVTHHDDDWLERGGTHR